MISEIKTKEFYFLSSNKEIRIHAKSWYLNDPSQIRAVLQIAHGMAEHIERYNDFANYMALQGFAVYANDHAGHGKSVNNYKDYGFFGENGSKENLVKDIHILSETAKKEWPDKPFFLLGHSMGSFLSRKYSTIYGKELSGVIYMGTGNGNPFIKIGIILANLIMKISGKKKEGKLLDKLAFGNFNQHITNPKSNFDWLSRNENNVKEYINDKLNGFIFTNSAFYVLFSLIDEVTSSQWAQKIPKQLPVLLISGDEDPVGDYGKGVIKTGKLLQEAGVNDISIKLFKNMRHEILNENKKNDVYKFINDWLIQHLSNSKKT